MLYKHNVFSSMKDSIFVFNNEFHSVIDPTLVFDVLIIDEYQDIETSFAEMLKIIKNNNPKIQIIAVGDMAQKVYDKTTLNVKEFIENFLGDCKQLSFTKCFRLSNEYAKELGKAWNKKIDGQNQKQTIEYVDFKDAISFFLNNKPGDILCLGSRSVSNGGLVNIVNYLEENFPDRYNKNTLYASIHEKDSLSTVSNKNDAAIFTTFDSSKGLERKICIVFDFDLAYYAKRQNMSNSSPEIIKNIFLVAASRGKEKIVFVNNAKHPFLNKPKNRFAFLLLHKKPIDAPKYLSFQISNMFDFKYEESIRKCFDLLEIEKIHTNDNSIIDIDVTDGNIDLSPCIGTYQEVLFWNMDVDNRIELYLKHEMIIRRDEKTFFQNEYEKIKHLPIDNKILFYTSMETGYLRYFKQVNKLPVSISQQESIIARLSTVFLRQEQVQTVCEIDFGSVNTKKFNLEKLRLIGRADVVKNNTVYELKFVTDLTTEHFLQCACYMIALNLEQGILWNIRDNTSFKIKIKNKELFQNEVIKTILKEDPETIVDKKEFVCLPKNRTCGLQIKKKTYNNEKYIAVIDTETNFNDNVFSIGIAIGDASSFDFIDAKYFIIEPDCDIGGVFSNRLYDNIKFPITKTTREKAIIEIEKILEKYQISSIFQYSTFDKRHLRELSLLDWYDITKVAAYKQHNRYIPDDMPICKTGRMKGGFGAEEIYRLVSKDMSYVEKHHALLDAIDELKIMKMLGVPLYVFKCA